MIIGYAYPTHMSPALFVILATSVALLWIAASVRRRLAETSYAIVVELIEAVLWAYMIYVVASFILEPSALNDWSKVGHVLLPVGGISGKQGVAALLGVGVGWYRFFERPFPQPPQSGEIIRGRRSGPGASASKKPGLLERFRRFLHRLQQ